MNAEQLQRELKNYFETQELPGGKAQMLMAPSSRNPEARSHERPPIASAVLILLYKKEEKWHLALIKRSSYKGSHSAQISLPGGKMERDDANLMACALRETYEEIGIHCPQKQILGALSPLYIPISNFKVNPFVGLIDFAPHFATDTHEVKHLIELPLEVILNGDYQQQREIISQKHHITTPVYQLEDDYIWGATAMILSEFAEIIKTIV